VYRFPKFGRTPALTRSFALHWHDVDASSGLEPCWTKPPSGPATLWASYRPPTISAHCRGRYHPVATRNLATSGMTTPPLPRVPSRPPRPGLEGRDEGPRWTPGDRRFMLADSDCLP